MTTPFTLTLLSQPFEALAQAVNTNTPASSDTSDSITSLMSGQFADHYTNTYTNLWHYAGALIMYTIIAMGAIYMVYFYLKKQPKTLAKLKEMTGHPDILTELKPKNPALEDTSQIASSSPISKKPLNHLISLAAVFQKEPQQEEESPKEVTDTDNVVEIATNKSNPITISDRIQLVETTPVAQSADGSEMGVAIINIDGHDMVFRYSGEGLTLIKSGLVSHITQPAPTVDTESTAFRLSQQLTHTKVSKKRMNSLKSSPLPKGSLLWKTSSTI